MNPEQYNVLSTVNFKLVLEKIPNVVYYSQDVPLPAVSMDSPNVPQPGLMDLKFGGTKVMFEPLTITFLVDEDLKNLIELYDWMFKIQVENHTRNHYSDGTLHILNGNKETTNRIHFYNMFPVSVSNFSLTTKDTDSTPAECSVTFNYSIFMFDVMVDRLKQINSPLTK